MEGVGVGAGGEGGVWLLGCRGHFEMFLGGENGRNVLVMFARSCLQSSPMGRVEASRKDFKVGRVQARVDRESSRCAKRGVGYFCMDYWDLTASSNQPDERGNY